MPGISEQGTTFNLPNFVGELYATTPQDTPFLSAIGGLTGGEETTSSVFTWQTYDLRDADDSRQRKEGADAPDGTARKREKVTQVLEVHQEALEVSYTKQAAVGLVSASGTSHPHGASVPGVNPVTNEIDWQTEAHVAQIARDVEKSFISGTFQDPSDNDDPRKTRGILQAISTNDEDANGDHLSEDIVLDLLQSVWENGGIMQTGTATLMAAGAQKRYLTRIFVKDNGYRQDSRNVGGVGVDTILTDFGQLNVMLNRHMPADTVAVVSLEQCAPVFMRIPDKGHFFVEPLATTGAASKFQIYGEIGLKYGNEKAHGKITGLATSTLPPS